MNSFLDIYLSSFWSWSGITIGIGVTLSGTAAVIAAWRR